MAKRAGLIAIDLFAGAGGFSLAAVESGFQVVAAIEVDKHCCTTYRENLIVRRKSETILLQQDIEGTDWLQVLREVRISPGDCDLLMGGPPCQGFSTHRIKDAGVDDPRNSLLSHYFAGIDAIRPKVFVVENVSGLLWPRHARFLNRFLRMSRSAGYRVFGPTLLNARDYGVPQNRKRVFIVGVRSDLDLQFQWPLPTHFDDRSPAWVPASKVFAIPLNPKDPNAVHMKHSLELVKVFKSTPRSGSRHDSIRTLPCHERHDGHKDVYGRIHLDQPGPTMTTACINPSKGRFVHPTRHHGITARHAARFQSFPDDFVFAGGLIAAGKQIGNAVPILMGKAILQQIAKHLRDK